MTERKVCMVEFTEAEVIGLLETLLTTSSLAGFEFSDDVTAAIAKIKQALAAEQGTGGYFDRDSNAARVERAGFG